MLNGIFFPIEGFFLFGDLIILCCYHFIEFIKLSQLEILLLRGYLEGLDLRLEFFLIFFEFFNGLILFQEFVVLKLALPFGLFLD